MISRLISGFHDCECLLRGSEFDQVRTDGVASSACPQMVHPRRLTRDQGVLELVDLAGVKINEPKPGRLSMIMY
jgi:hypothetical protein